MVVLPTGTGKTITALSVVSRALEKGSRVWWLAHRSELVEQPLRSLNAVWPHLEGMGGIVQASRDDVGAQCVFASVQTLFSDARLRRLMSAGAPDLVFVDECHHAAAERWVRLLEDIDSGCAESGARLPYRCGLTATPFREDSRSLKLVFDSIAFQYPISQAIQRGFLAGFEHKVVKLPSLDLDTVQTKRNGEFKDDALEDALLSAHVVEHTVDALFEHGQGRKGIIFCVSIRQCEQSAELANQRGIPSGVIHGGMSAAARVEVLRRHRSGELRMLFNVQVLTEGYDDPSVDLVMIARPMRSKGLYLQCVGRGLRLFIDKTSCLILDIAGASNEHSMVTAPVLLGVEEEKEKGEREGGGARQRRHALAGLTERRERSVFRWIDVRYVKGRAWACSAGQQGQVAVFERDGRFSAVWMPRGASPEVLVEGDPAGSLPMAIAEDLVRRAEGSKLSKKRQPWLDEPPSAGQERVLRSLGFRSVPASKGEASDLITEGLVRRSLVRHKFMERAS